LSVFGTDGPLLAPSLVALVFSPLFGGTPQNRQTRPDLDGSDDFGVSHRKEAKKQVQQVMEPSVAHQCQKQTKKDTCHIKIALSLC
jgi:hypothetical protein